MTSKIWTSGNHASVTFDSEVLRYEKQKLSHTEFEWVFCCLVVTVFASGNTASLTKFYCTPTQTREFSKWPRSEKRGIWANKNDMKHRPLYLVLTKCSAIFGLRGLSQRLWRQDKTNIVMRWADTSLQKKIKIKPIVHQEYFKRCLLTSGTTMGSWLECPIGWSWQRINFIWSVFFKVLSWIPRLTCTHCPLENDIYIL